MTMKKSCCRECRFYVGGDYDGYCHRRAPIAELVLTTAGGSVHYNKAIWPDIKANDWCGEFEQNPNKPGNVSAPREKE